MPPIRPVLGTILSAPWSRTAWRATRHVVAGAPLGFAGAVLVLMLILASVVLAPTVLLALGTLVALVRSNRLLASWQRARFRALLGIRIPEPVPARLVRPAVSAASGGLRRTLREALLASTWRQVSYHLLMGTLGIVVALLVVGAWSAGVALSGMVIYTGIWGGLSAVEAAAWTLLGVGILWVAPWVARGAAALDVVLAMRLLGDGRDDLSRRVALLTQSRDRAVAAADAERRRIERDLHDGAQQRLTALAMNLGMARATLTDLPAPAQDVIVQSHEEAKQALVELRDLVRGLHPAVLDDRGLDAALSAVVARSPVPVRLHVAISERVAPSIESVAYFVVAEALTNVAKHAHASHATVTLQQDHGRLRVQVVDDGAGGADPARGSGLRGLAQRAESVEGTLRVDSPVGGPTVLTVELPCAL